MKITKNQYCTTIPKNKKKKAKSYLVKLKELGCEVAMKPKEETKKVLEEQKI